MSQIPVKPQAITPPATPAAFDAETPMEQLLGLAYQLAGVVEEENRLLAMGFPSSLAVTTEEKLRLSREIEAVMADAESKRRTAAANIDQRSELARSIRRIEEAVQENSSRLDGAIHATKRRIAAVMTAVRDEASSQAPTYGAKGHRATTVEGGAIRTRLI
jgi:flagellar biosynthesis/type III secretory pathway chaperone